MKQLWRQLFSERRNGHHLNTAKLWINVYAALGATGVLLVYAATAAGVVQAILGIPAVFAFLIAALHLMVWRAQKDRKASDLKGALQSSAQTVGRAGSGMRQALNFTHLARIGGRNDDERG